MQDFRQLDVWNKAHELTVLLYRSTPTVSERKYPGLISQMRRSASSIPANIAEECGHGSQRELGRFLQVALASAHELHYHLMLAHDLAAIPPASFARLDARAEQVKKMLTGLLRRVRGEPRGGRARTKAPPAPMP